MPDASRPVYGKAVPLGPRDREALSNVATGLRRLYQLPDDDVFADLLKSIASSPRKRRGLFFC